MKNVTQLQEAIERKAKEKLESEIARLHYAYEDLLKDFAITKGIEISISGPENSTNRPYLSQFFMSEIVKEAIIRKYLDTYVSREIQNILYPPKNL